MRRRITLVLTLGASVFVVAGCQSSSVAQRRAQRMEAYQSLDAATRRLVDGGRIQNGMDTNAVFIAWAQPTDAFTVELPGGGQRMIWNYEQKWSYQGKRLVPAGASYGRTLYAVERWQLPINYVAKSVTFDRGNVVQWKKYDPPAYNQPPEMPPFSPHAF